MVAKKKIAFFLGGMSRGGAERVISILSDYFAKQGWKTDIIAMLSYKLEYDIDKSTRFLDFTGNGTSKLRRLPYWIYKIKDYLKKEAPDVVLSFFAPINILVLVAARRTGIPVVVSERNDPHHDGRSRIVQLLAERLYPKAGCIVFQTNRARKCFGDRVQKISYVIPNPVSVTTYADSVKSKKIVTAGRLMKQKNHRLLIEGFCSVLKKHPEYDLWIYGEGVLRNELIAYSRELEIESKVHFPGNQKNLHREIADAEMFVLSSDFEGLSNALMEAMMMGLPCISTNVAGSEELIRNGENGILVETGNRVELTNAMLDIIEHPDSADRMARQAKSDLKSFSKEFILEEWEKVIVGQV